MKVYWSSLSVLSTRYSALVVIGAVFLGALDQTVIVTVLPAVVTDLQIPFNRLDEAAWIVSGYLLGYTIALPLMGHFADARGHRRTFLVGIGLFTVGSIGCALAPSLAALIAARVIQAFGGGALLPVSIAIVTSRYEGERRSVAIGVIGAAAEAGGVLGPLWGALIVQHLDWRWIFWLNAPFGLFLFAFAARTLADHRETAGRLDRIGAALGAGVLTGLILGLAREQIKVAGFDLRAALLVASVVGAAAFIW